MLHRRQFLTALLGTAALTAVPTAARAAVDLEPLQPDTLTAFVQTICPLQTATHADGVRALTSPDLPFHKVVKVFTLDLNVRSRKRHGAPFAALSPAQRADVVHAGLTARSVLRRLYAGAVYVAQLATTAGIYSPETGNPAIGFQGAYHFDGYDSLTFPQPHSHLPRPRTADGNPP